tara:strand:- start:7341 stop:7529 length:189 start_codon:yes stop_codon:yes gene_type:complete
MNTGWEWPPQAKREIKKMPPGKCIHKAEYMENGYRFGDRDEDLLYCPNCNRNFDVFDILSDI